MAAVSGRAMLPGSNDAVVDLGKHILALVARHEDDAAARWLGWFADDDHATTAMTVAVSLYKAVVAKGAPPREAMELVASLIVAPAEPALALPVLRRCAIPGDDAARECLIARLVALGELDRWREMADAAHGLPQSDPGWLSVASLRALALARAGDVAASSAVLDAALARNPGDRLLLKWRIKIAVDTAPWPTTQIFLDMLLAAPNVQAVDFNSAAWLHLAFDSSHETARALAERGAQLETRPSAALANTQAAIDAESDRPLAAYGHLAQAMDMQVDGAPRGADWYVIGRIAETVGLRDDAIAAYMRVRKPRHPDGPSAFTLAARRLERLRAR